ncbi:MAG: hypothetical protein ABI821_19235 [Pseudomonadota bacterium]
MRLRITVFVLAVLAAGNPAQAEITRHGVRMDVYEHGYHDFVLGNQGHTRGDLRRGEILLPGALDALELTIKFLKQPGQ